MTRYLVKDRVANTTLYWRKHSPAATNYIDTDSIKDYWTEDVRNAQFFHSEREANDCKDASLFDESAEVICIEGI